MRGLKQLLIGLLLGLAVSAAIPAVRADEPSRVTEEQRRQTRALQDIARAMGQLVRATERCGK